MFKRILQLMLVGSLTAGALYAAEDPFVGDWKLNPSKSKLTDVMKVESLGGNKYNFDLGGDGGSEIIVVDGTDQPGVAGTTVSVTAEGPDAWKVVRKKDGRMVLFANWKLSPDGNTLNDNFNAVSADGSTATVNYVYQKKGGGSGFAGRWVSTKEDMTEALKIQIKTSEDGGLSFTGPGGTTNIKFNGKSVRRLNASTMEIVRESPGKITTTRHYKVSPDLKTLTITTRISGRDEPQIMVFERQ